MADGKAPASPLVVEGPAPVGAANPVVALYEESVPELRRFVLGVTRDPDLADDVLQATFVKALERGHEARTETARGWLFRVAFHEALALRRRSAAFEKGKRRLADLAIRPGPRPDDPLVRLETLAAVRTALRALPNEQRLVVLARLDDDKTFAEIARDLGLPLGTVLTRMRRALEKIRKALNPGA